jgi:hypothetical protein
VQHLLPDTSLQYLLQLRFDFASRLQVGWHSDSSGVHDAARNLIGCGPFFFDVTVSFLLTVIPPDVGFSRKAGLDRSFCKNSVAVSRFDRQVAVPGGATVTRGVARATSTAWRGVDQGNLWRAPTMPARRPMFNERTLLSGESVRLSNDVVRVGSPHATEDAGTSHGEPKLELIRLGDRIQAIDVVCGCGQRTRIRCVYE